MLPVVAGRRAASLLAVTTTTAQAYGPSALGGSLKRFIELTLTLARTEFKLRYFGSVLGYFWSLIRPLLFFGVIYVFFTQILSLGGSIPNYGVYLLTGIVLWSYFGEATGNCVTCLVAREAMLRKVRFPRLAIPLSVSLTAAFNLAMNFIAVIVFALLSGISPRLSWLWLIPIALGFVVLATGVGMLLSVLYVRFRDIQPIWDVVSQILFYSAPIMYTAVKYRGLEHAALLNPIAMMLTQMGYAFIHPGLVFIGPSGICHGPTAGCAPNYPMRSAAAASGGMLHVLISIGIILLVFAIAWWVFTREAPRVAENL
jgi:ABC-2 type transport system permease protein